GLQPLCEFPHAPTSRGKTKTRCAWIRMLEPSHAYSALARLKGLPSELGKGLLLRNGSLWQGAVAAVAVAAVLEVLVDRAVRVVLEALGVLAVQWRPMLTLTTRLLWRQLQTRQREAVAPVRLPDLVI